MKLSLKDELAKLGGNDVPWLGFGTAHLGADGERETATRALNQAFEHGIRYFDTARLYGAGESELVIGEVFADKRDQVFLTSKAGIIPWKDRQALRMQNKLRRLIGLKPVPVDNLFGAFALSQLKASFEKSLRSLRTDYVDCLLLHECSLENAINEDVVAWAMSLKDAGKIRAFGSAATNSESDRILALSPDHLDFVQHGFDINSAPFQVPSKTTYERVTHSALTHILSAVNVALGKHPEKADTLQQDIGFDLRNFDQLVPRLLLHSHRHTNGSQVLFSTAKPERIGATISAFSGIGDDDGTAMKRLKALIAD